jgi:hypothetical protein
MNFWLQWPFHDSGESSSSPVKAHVRSQTHVRYVVDEVTLGQAIFRVLRFSPVSVIPPVSHCSLSGQADSDWDPESKAILSRMSLEHCTQNTFTLCVLQGSKVKGKFLFTSLDQRLPQCGPRIPWERRPFPMGPVGTFL